MENLPVRFVFDRKKQAGETKKGLLQIEVRRFNLVMRNKQDIAVLSSSSVSLRVVKIIKHRVSRRDTELIVTCYLFFIP